ncbi:hypothetical protein ACFL54_05915, partial [Planctomycetota bacterium]
VLIVVLGALALMSILALTFVSMMRLERSISANYVDRTRAVMAAESGIEAAIARLSGLTGGVLPAGESERMRYNPDDPNAPLNKATRPSFMSSDPGPGDMPISGTVGSTYTNNGDLYLLKVDDESGKLNLNDHNEQLFHIISNLGLLLFPEKADPYIGTAIAYSVLAGRDRVGGHFSLMNQVRNALVEPPSPDNPVLTANEFKTFANYVTLWSWQDPDVIKPIPAFGSLDNALELYGNPDPDNGFPRYGFPFMRWEEVQSFNDGDDNNGLHDYGYQLEPRSPVNVNTASRELIQALLAGLEGWTVFEGPSEQYQSTYWGADKTRLSSLGGYYYGYWGPMGLINYDNGLESYPNFLYETTPRTSPWLHDAANKLVLDECSIPDFKRLGLPFARLRSTKIPDLNTNPDFSAALADDLYDRIHGCGIYGESNPVENWREFKFYLDTVIARAKAGELPALAIVDPFAADESEATWSYDRSGDFQYFNEYYRDLILANFDPNTMTNDFNPDLVVYRHTDKADLICYSTEFSFEPTGTFKIESLGRICGRDTASSIQAEQSVTAVTRLFEFKRLSTQSQLVGHNTSSAAMSEQFGENESPTVTKWGDIVGYENGARLVSHPEPIIEISPGQYQFEFVKNGIFDGRIGLSQVKHNTGKILPGLDNEGNPEDISAVLWTWFEGGMNAENENGTVYPGQEAESDSIYKFNTPDAKSHFDIAIQNAYDNSLDAIAEELREHENPLMVPHANGTSNQKPGTLFVDGVFSEAWKTPAYEMVANGVKHHSGGGPKKGKKQTLLMALKPGFLMKDSNRSRNFFVMGQGGGRGGNQNVLVIARLKHCFGSWNNQSWQGPPPEQQRHPLAFGWGWGSSCYQRGIHFARTNFVGTNEDSDRKYRVDRTNSYGIPLTTEAYHFEGRRWNLIAATWRFNMQDKEGVKFISINGQQSDLQLHSVFHFQPTGLLGWYGCFDYWADDFRTPIRLGEFSRPQGPVKSVFEPADSTYGEFIFYKKEVGDPALFAHLDTFFWDDGFYYHDPGYPAAYTTPEIDLGAKSRKPVTIRSISWTGRWPDYMCANPVADDEYFDPVWGCDDYQAPQWLTANCGKWAPFLVDIKTDDTWHYVDDEIKLINSGGSMPTDTDGNTLETEESIQLKFYFNVADKQDDEVEPLRESPYLDDITITYLPAGAPRILFYLME